MFLRIETFPATRLVGKRLEMSFANNRTFELWKGFMPRRHELANIRNADLFSLQIYPKGFDYSDELQTFEKWAAISVGAEEAIPDGMEAIEIPSGKYAVFLHTGSPDTAAATFGYIFNHWLPNSGFEVDDRPHFEILGKNYKNGSVDSEEEVFVPVR